MKDIGFRILLIALAIIIIAVSFALEIGEKALDAWIFRTVWEAKA